MIMVRLIILFPNIDDGRPSGQREQKEMTVGADVSEIARILVDVVKLVTDV